MLVLVIAMIALIGLEMFILSGGSNAILFQSNNAYLEACERNLTASGLAWAEKNIKNENIESFNRMIELNIANMNIRRSTLSVVMCTPLNKQTEVQINASCSRGRQTLESNDKYRIQFR